MQKGRANVILDGQWGSTGKGKLVGHLALKNDISVATCDFMSNAGHTFVHDDGKKIVTCQLPTSLVNPDTILCINPGGAITMKKLLQEVEELGVWNRLFIHPHTAIIEEEDREHEAKMLSRISSTLKGCGGSLSRKVMRVAKLAKDDAVLSTYGWIKDTSEIVQSSLRSGGTVLVEGAQGFDLSLNHGFAYPYVTSRDVTTMSIMNNAGIPAFYLGDVYGCLRTFPIRVGDMFDKEGNKIGTSGPHHDDQEELTWPLMRELSGASRDLTELTTVTQKIRRVFTFSHKQVERFIRTCAPTDLFINFINHVNAEDEKKRMLAELSTKSKAWVYGLQSWLNTNFSDLRDVPAPDISYIGTGERDSDMIIV